MSHYQRTAPAIEALPPMKATRRHSRSICWQPVFDASKRSMPIGLRVSRLFELRNLIIPLERHCEFLYTLEWTGRRLSPTRDALGHQESARILTGKCRQIQIESLYDDLPNKDERLRTLAL